MGYRRLYFLVEGYTDKKFVEEVFRSLLAGRYDHIQGWEYSKKSPQEIRKFISSIRSMGADFFILTDINSAVCKTSKKRELCEKWEVASLEDRMIVVVREIEGWYLAGMSEDLCRRSKVSLSSTDSLTKESFDKLVPKGRSPIDFRTEILKNYSLETAKRKNTSFGYLCKRIGI
ncbi:MAG: hypothetical protein WHS88_00100 [Anaerohalosphaeraceae bacterium]